MIKFADRVKIVSGFYEGCVGRVMDKRPIMVCESMNKYYVVGEKAVSTFYTIFFKFGEWFSENEIMKVEE